MKKVLSVLLICMSVITITGCSEKKNQKNEVVEKKTEESESIIKFKLPKEAQTYKVTDSFAQDGDIAYEEKNKEYKDKVDLSGVESAIGNIIFEQNNVKVRLVGIVPSVMLDGQFEYVLEVENTNNFDIKFSNEGNYVNGILLEEWLGGGTVKANATEKISAGNIRYEDCVRANVNNVTSITSKFRIYDDNISSFEILNDPSLALHIGDLNIAGEKEQYVFDPADKEYVINLKSVIVQLDAFEVEYSNAGYDMYFLIENTSDKELEVSFKNFKINDQSAATYAPSYQEWLNNNDISYSVVMLHGEYMEKDKIDKNVKSLSFDIEVRDNTTLETIETQKVLFEAE